MTFVNLSLNADKVRWLRTLLPIRFIDFSEYQSVPPSPWSAHWLPFHSPLHLTYSFIGFVTLPITKCVAKLPQLSQLNIFILIHPIT
jgi:hypothetical protein